MHRTLLCLALLALSSCASALKKQCEETNWFDQGKSVALSGKFPASDDFVNSCRKEEAKINESLLSQGFKEGRDAYCTPEGALATGKKGQRFNAPFCDGPGVKLLEPKHAEGVRVFCAQTNGYPIGASGQVYDGICPKDLEGDFKSEYRRGRKVYLQAQIEASESLARQKEQEAMELERDRAELSQRGNALAGRYLISDGLDRSLNAEQRERRRQDYDSEKWQINQEIASKQREIEERRAERSAAQRKAEMLRAELKTLN